MTRSRVARMAIAGTAAIALTLSTTGCAKIAGIDGHRYPSHTVEMVVPYPAGGGTDSVARMLADVVNKRGGLDSRVEVVNVEGGAGTVGMGKVLNAENDGYTIGFVPDGPLTLSPHVDDVPYDPAAYTPVTIPTEDPVLIAVKADSPFRTLDDLIGAAGKRPDSVTLGEGPLNYRAPANLLEREAGVAFKRVGFDGDAATTTALLGGNIDATVTQLSAIQGQMKAGQVRVLASSGARRDEEALPGVPTMVDSGHRVVWNAYTAVVAPDRLDPEAAGTLTKVFSEAVASPEFADAVQALGVSPLDGKSGDAAGAVLDAKFAAAGNALDGPK